MLDFMKVLIFCAIGWAVIAAVPVASVLIGSALALWILYIFVQAANEDLDDDESDGPNRGTGS